MEAEEEPFAVRAATCESPRATSRGRGKDTHALVSKRLRNETPRVVEVANVFAWPCEVGEDF